MRRRRRRRHAQVGVALGLGIVLSIAALLTASPRHRAFYSRLFGRSPASVPSVTAPRPDSPLAQPGPAPAAPGGQPQASPPGPASARPPGFATPIPPETTQRPSPPPIEGKQKIPPPASPSPIAAAKVPRGGPGDQVVVKILDEIPARLPLAGVPPEWELKEFAGRAQVEVVRDADRIVLHLSSERTSFALYRDVALDVKAFPILTWWWKITKLPTGGDIRERASDDQAAQVYVIFPRWPFPRINSDVLGYIWDSRAPMGLRVTSPQSTNVKLVVLQSGAERLGQWVREERNVYQDYVESFGKEPPRVGKVAIMIDSNDTRSQAEAFVDELVFRRAPARTSSADPGASR